jgi:hypothetical protein
MLARARLAAGAARTPIARASVAPRRVDVWRPAQRVLSDAPLRLARERPPLPDPRRRALAVAAAAAVAVAAVAGAGALEAEAAGPAAGAAEREAKQEAQAAPEETPEQLAAKSRKPVRDTYPLVTEPLTRVELPLAANIGKTRCDLYVWGLSYDYWWGILPVRYTTTAVYMERNASFFVHSRLFHRLGQYYVPWETVVTADCDKILAFRMLHGSKSSYFIDRVMDVSAFACVSRARRRRWRRSCPAR